MSSYKFPLHNPWSPPMTQVTVWQSMSPDSRKSSTNSNSRFTERSNLVVWTLLLHAFHWKWVVQWPVTSILASWSDLVTCMLLCEGLCHNTQAGVIWWPIGCPLNGGMGGRGGLWWFIMVSQCTQHHLSGFPSGPDHRQSAPLVSVCWAYLWSKCGHLSLCYLQSNTVGTLGIHMWHSSELWSHF